MTKEELVLRNDLYEKVWGIILEMTHDAAPGSITPQTFARVSVDVVLSELLKAGAIVPGYRDDKVKSL